VTSDCGDDSNDQQDQANDFEDAKAKNQADQEQNHSEDNHFRPFRADARPALRTPAVALRRAFFPAATRFGDFFILLV
jgi:hypothetical protein